MEAIGVYSACIVKESPIFYSIKESELKSFRERYRIPNTVELFFLKNKSGSLGKGVLL